MQSILEKNNSLFSTLKNFKDSFNSKVAKKQELDDKSAYLGGSISQYTKNLVLTFPTMCDNSLPADTVGMISKAHERNLVSMFEMLFASKTLSGTDGVQILRKIHKNININSDIGDIIDAINTTASLADGNYTPGKEYNDYKNTLSYEASKFSAKDRAIIREAASEMVNYLKSKQKSYPVNSFNEKSLNEYTVFNKYGKTVIIEKSINDPIDSYAYGLGDTIGNTDDNSLNYSEELRKQREEKRKEAQDKRSEDETKLKMMQMSNDLLSKRLVDMDVKKANELTPSLMIINYNVVDNSGAVTCQKSFIAGVKSRLISVDSTDIMDRLASKNKTKVNFLNFIRATTGEIHFISDFLLSLKQSKLNAKNASKKGPSAMMWNFLEKRSTKNSINKFSKSGNDASSITTLVINQETVNMLKKVYGFDIENISNAKYILDQYNLLGIVICDESIKVAKFFYDGNDLYESQPYSFLERESNDNSYKKVINLLNSSGR